MTALDVLDRQARLVSELLHAIPHHRWTDPGLGEWTIGELAAHLVRAADRITHYLDQPLEGGGDVAVDRVSYFRYDHAEAAAGVAERSRTDAARIGPGGYPSAFDAAWHGTVERCEAVPHDRLLPTFMGTMRLDEYAATRVLELVVHGMDLSRALGVRPDVDDEALRLTAGILEGLLDGPRPAGIDDATWVMIATGRDAHPDHRLPVLS